jgi:predicted deacylase
MTAAVKERVARPDISRARDGNTGVEGVWQFPSGHPGRHVLVTALIHGNEFSGARALVRLLDAGLRPKRGVLTVALCNLEAFDRFDAAHPDAARFVDEDMNRVWTPERLADPSTRERRRALQLLPFVESADWLLDLHSMHEPSPPLLLTGTSWRDLSIARRLGTPSHVVIDPGHREGRRLRDFGQFGPDGRPDAASLLLEAGHHFDAQAQEVAEDVLGRFLDLSGIVDPQDVPHDWLRATPGVQSELTVTHAYVAKSMAFRFSGTYTGLEVIESAGSVIAHDGDVPVCTPYDNCVLVMPSVRQLRPGVTVVRFAMRAPLRR